MSVVRRLRWLCLLDAGGFVLAGGSLAARAQAILSR
jgi:hypothetical protein